MAKKGKGKKGKKGKPEWMSEELFALSQEPMQLVDNFRGASDKSSTPCTISKEQVLLHWCLLILV
jgi:hypothetical protein